MGKTLVVTNDFPPRRGGIQSFVHALACRLPAGSVAIGVVIEPLVAWLWAGGLLIGVGGLLALVPGARRRATDPASAPAPLVTDAPRDGRGEDRQPETAPEPVDALVARGVSPA